MKIHRLKESDLINKIKKEFSQKDLDIEVNIGDDSAVINFSGKRIFLTKDILSEDIHFTLDFNPPYYLGRKCVAVNLSDLAAMGAKPRFALLGLCLSPEIDRKWVDEFLNGFRDICKEFKVNLIGGDISSSKKIFISVTLIGEGDKGIERNGAKPEDKIFVSGSLGNASYGLSLLKKGIRLGEHKKYDFFIKSFLDPKPKVELGKKLREKGAVSAMIDISDGLSTDLFNLCEASNVGAVIYKDKLPVSENLLLEKTEEKYNYILHGGEDYELLFTVSPQKEKEVINLSERITYIGYITEKERGIKIIDSKGKESTLKKEGYEHLI
ncbi:thiamine-phosphate kinase [Candidatus Aminicenantes bacterium AC-335-A11]|jgi:thiamine-monophosphate kinase|nr:thiamine-phosphate kinase [SCandidatus Aminicenantes bacterium Aminicenantia_JdfR_composite]MCP2606318.1 thiamine-phosphate kinase [Candidatus Aminicenantes bacterium AC-708-I09]MCP2617975.1 thiamine-phosphate kinase [Candidatus Aminicenantes bacterium AC-335-A11]